MSWHVLTARGDGGWPVVGACVTLCMRCPCAHFTARDPAIVLKRAASMSDRHTQQGQTPGGAPTGVGAACNMLSSVCTPASPARSLGAPRSTLATPHFRQRAVRTTVRASPQVDAGSPFPELTYDQLLRPGERTREAIHSAFGRGVGRGAVLVTGLDGFSQLRQVLLVF